MEAGTERRLLGVGDLARGRLHQGETYVVDSLDFGRNRLRAPRIPAMPRSREKVTDIAVTGTG